MWRYDNPQYARYRSFFQWDAEIYGCSEAEADAEIIALTVDILENVGLDFEIRISNRKLIEGFLLGLGIEKKSLLDVLRVIDKKSKVAEKELSNEFKKYGLTNGKVKKILQFCSITSLEKVKALLPKNDLANEGFIELENLFALLKAYKKSNKCRLDLSIVRGIDYYTGIVYEAWIKGESDIGAVAGGGRYDDLLGLYGKPMPATGIAGGIERLLLSLEKANVLPEIASVPKFFLAYATPDVFNDALEVLRKTRETGLSIAMDLNKRDLRKQFEYANKIGVQFVLIVGKKELAAGKLRLRDMKSGDEKEIDLEELKSL
jgi:histidyl-tRNA synthetase